MTRYGHLSAPDGALAGNLRHLSSLYTTIPLEVGGRCIIFSEILSATVLLGRAILGGQEGTTAHPHSAFLGSLFALLHILPVTSLAEKKRSRPLTNVDDDPTYARTELAYSFTLLHATQWLER